MITCWAFAGFWTVTSITLLPMAWLELGPLAAFFPATAVGLICYAARQAKQWRRYGITRLTLDPYPGSIGGHVGGHIELGRRAGAEQGYEVTLECVHSYMSGSGKNRSRRYDIEWEASGPAAASQTASGLRLAFRFDVPEGLPQSEKKRGEFYYWRLQLRGDQQDVPLERTFDIAVFPTGEHSRYVDANTTAAGREAASAELAGALTSSHKAAELREDVGLSIEQRGDWLRLLFHPGRQKFLAAIMLTVGLSFFAALLFAEFDDGLARLIFGALGAIATGAGVYLPNNTLDVRISPREIKRERSLFGVVIRRQRIRPEQLHKLDIAEGASMYIGDKTTVYYQLVGKGSFGKFQLVDGIADRGLVEAIREHVVAHARLRFG